jgi:hypothetical protein
MNRLSRREFLKRSGTMAWATPTALHSLSEQMPTQAENSLPMMAAAATVGRAFALTLVYEAPQPESELLVQLAPDSVNDIIAISGDQNWYRVARGWVQRSALQPILPYQYPTIYSATPGFWAQVVAPVSAVRQWCAVRAPIVARVGFGGVLYVLDRIDDDRGQVWYGLAAEPNSLLVGWSPALHYARWTPTSEPASDAKNSSLSIRIQIDSRQSQLIVSAHSQVIGRMPIFAVPLASTETTIKVVQPGASSRSPILGTPWLMQLASGALVHGAFWHNNFGTRNQDVNDAAITLDTFAARWLYQLLLASGGASVTITA